MIMYRQVPYSLSLRPHKTLHSLNGVPYKGVPLSPMNNLPTYLKLVLITYRIAGKFGGDFNLAVWRIVRTSPNLNSRQI